MSGNDWGGVELMEKLNLMEMEGIGQTPSSNYLINATEFFLLASISHFSFSSPPICIVLQTVCQF